MDRSLIDVTLERINNAYQPGMLAWVKKRRPKDWKRLLNCESKINRAAIQGDQEGLNKTLIEYEGFVLKMMKLFRPSKGETGSLF